MKNVFAQWGDPKMVQVVKTTGVRADDIKSALQRPKSIKMKAGPPQSAPNRTSNTRGALTVPGGPVAPAKEEKSRSEAATQKLQGGVDTKVTGANSPLKACAPHPLCERIDLRTTTEPYDGKASIVEAPRQPLEIVISRGRVRRVSRRFARRHCVHRANRGWWLR